LPPWICSHLPVFSVYTMAPLKHIGRGSRQAFIDLYSKVINDRFINHPGSPGFIHGYTNVTRPILCISIYLRFRHKSAIHEFPLIVNATAIKHMELQSSNQLRKCCENLLSQPYNLFFSFCDNIRQFVFSQMIAGPYLLCFIQTVIPPCGILLQCSCHGERHRMRGLIVSCYEGCPAPPKRKNTPEIIMS